MMSRSTVPRRKPWVCTARPPTTTQSTLCSASAARIARASRTSDALTSPPAGRGQLGAQLAERYALRQSRGVWKGPLFAHIPRVIAAGQRGAVQHRLLSHHGQQQSEARPRDLLLPTFDASDSTLAGARAVSQLTLGEPVSLARRPDELRRHHDAVYGIKAIRFHTSQNHPRHRSGPSWGSALGGVRSGFPG